MVIRERLSNGLPVICETLEHAHSVAFGVWIKVGSQDEDMGNNGMAHMIEHMVFKGTPFRTAERIADEIAEIGGNLDAYTSKEWTSFYGWVLPEHLPKAINLLGDLVSHPCFGEKELSREKGIVMEEIDMYKDSPEDVVHEVLQQKIWEGHPLGFLISGEREVVATFERQGLEKFHQTFYAADNMLFSIAGRVNMEEIRPYLERAFSSLVVHGKKSENTCPVFCPCIYVEEKDIEQVHINIAYESITSISEERYEFSVLNAILGGGVNSRLFMKIREEMGIAYTIYSYGSSFEKAGLFHIYAAVNPSQTKSALEAIANEIRRFEKEGVTQEELIRAREQIKTDLIIQGESTKGHMSSNAREFLQFGHVISLEETLSRINQVDQEDIMRCVRCYFSEKRMGAAFAGNIAEVSSSIMKETELQKIFAL